ncbi:WRC [Macleaya cordata]|uniref:Growth-regulating factor n=1 Tax=Macleaya cordata TaxID=56857 RepID=A0A200PZI3_MACCD|nr:WRC [Macleaya cordata]
MEYDLNQWRNQHQLEQQPSAKIPRLFLEAQNTGSSSETALPFFVPEPNSKISSLSAFPDSITTAYRFPRLGGGLFSLAQWQELELQALIFKYMLAGAAVPTELLQSIKKSFLNTPACCLHYPQQHYQHYQPTAMLQSGYWGRGSMDPEPGRCRRTDGKKWRCSRDVVPGQKYCERHVHRGRNRSRKPVEIPTPAAAAGGGLKIANATIASSSSSSPSTVVASGNNFTLSGSPSIELLHLNQRSSENKVGNRVLLETHNNKVPGEEKPDGQILRHFFDDWPRTNQESSGIGNNSSSATSTTCLSISTPGNPSSDFSLKLSTGNVDEPRESREGNAGGERPHLNWGVGWGTHQVSSMGGPLAEALRSSTTNSSPTSVLHELRRRGSLSETSSIST